MDYMAEDGIVGDHNGSSAREVLLTMEEWDAMQNASEAMTDEELEDAELMDEYDSEKMDEDFDDAEWEESEDDDIEWEEEEETVSVSLQSSLIANADDAAEDWADELDSEYDE